ncbi:MAG: hypothetical protein ABJD97_12700 [Betaproteobacteria bacterium]
MERFLHHSMRPDRTGTPPAWRQAVQHAARWLWPSTDADAGAHPADEAWSMKTMRWVPFVVPLSALFMLLLAVLIGSRL